MDKNLPEQNTDKNNYQSFHEVLGSQESLADYGGAPAGGGQQGPTRTNTAGLINSVGHFANIKNGAVVPYWYNSPSSRYYGWGGCVARDAVILAQNAYTFIAVVRSVIDMMTEFSSTKVKLVGGTAQSRKFFELWLDKIDIWQLLWKFFLEFYRSGNVFLYKLHAELSDANLATFKQVFGAKGDKNGKKKIPIKYLLLNPADITLSGTTSFVYPNYYKVLNAYEINSLFTSPSEEDVKIIEKIPELQKLAKDYKAKKPYESASMEVIRLPLAPSNLVTVFYHKQDYEGLAVPMMMGVMQELNDKIEVRKTDMAANRTILKAALLLTMGNQELGPPNPRQLNALRNLFTSDSVSQTIVADFTVKGQWLVPDMTNVFNPAKYQVLDEDIRDGLNNILFGTGKYANSQSKIKIFLARLEYGRKVFLQEFLKPEMLKIADTMGFNKIPDPIFEDINFEESAVQQRIYAQMAQMGLLTQEELVKAIETNELPNADESLESQRKYAEYRAEGLYQPLVGGANNSGKEAGRPEGTGVPQTTKEVAPIGTVSGAAQEDKKWRASEIIATSHEISHLESKITASVKSKYKVKRLNKQQKEVVADLLELVIMNSKKEDWDTTYTDFVEKSIVPRGEVYGEVHQLAAKLGVAPHEAAILYHT